MVPSLEQWPWAPWFLVQSLCSLGIPTLRLKGDYLAVATLGVSEIIRIFIINGGSLTNGASWYLRYSKLYQLANGLSICGDHNYCNSQLLYVVHNWTLYSICSWGWDCCRVRWVNTTKIKIIAFVFGAITASIVGSLQAGFIGSVVPKDYTFINSINVLIMDLRTWIDYWYHRFSDCFRNFKYAPFKT